MLNSKQKEICMEIWNQYKSGIDVSEPGGMSFKEWDRKRAEFGSEIRLVIDNYLASKIPLEDFKWTIDSLNKRNNLWGFVGWNGQFFFNMLLSSQDRFETDFEILLKKAIEKPNNIAEAMQKLNIFYSEVDKVASKLSDKRKGPKPGSAPYFQTYFWHIQNPDKWQIQYPSATGAYEMLGLWSKTGDVAEDYKTFQELGEEIHKLVKEKSKELIPYEEIGHAFYDYYLKQQEEISKGKPSSPVKIGTTTEKSKTPSVLEIGLPKSYIPPIVSILPQLAESDPDIQAACEAEGQDLARVFEKRVGVVFELLGFEVDMKGQGKGREPDVIAKCKTYHYALILDAKARKETYSVGTDDRTFIEYIKNWKPRLERDGIENIYFGVISSGFSNDKDPSIKEIKIRTRIHGVVMFKAEDLLMILEHRLRNPDQFDLGHPGFMSLLIDDGVVKRETIQEIFSIR